MSIYQLVGVPGMQLGTVVDMGDGGHRYGIIASVVKEDYKLPNPCVVTGAIKFINQKVNLYSIHSIDYKPSYVGGYVFGWRA